MDQFIEKYQNLKISAFDKVRQVNCSVHDITIGPNSSYHHELDIQCNKNENFQKKNKMVKSSIEELRQPTFDLRRLLELKEMQRRQNVYEAVSNRQKQIAEQQQIQVNEMKYQWLEKQKNLLLKVEQQELQIFQALEEHDKNSYLRNEQRQHYYQQLEARRRQKDLEIQAKEQRKRELQYIEKISKNQRDIALVYQDFLNLLKSNDIDETLKKSIMGLSQELRSLNLEMEEITQQCKVSVSANEVQKSSDLLQQILSLKNKAELNIIEYNKQKEITAKNLENTKNNEITKNTNTTSVLEKSQEVPKSDKLTTNIDRFVSKASFCYYSELQDYLLNHEKSYKDLLTNNSLKQFRFDCKKAVNIPVNAISSINSQHLLDKYNKLSNLLSGKLVPVGDSQICAAQHPQGIAFCMDLLAKKFILQGDLMISSNPEAAFYYASIILSLWNEFPEFGKLLLAHFHKQCPYLVPIHLPKTIEQTDEEYYKSLGYQYNDGIVEKQDKFLKRMTGIMRLYSAIIISKPKKSQSGLHPHGITQGWRWLTATLNLEPKTDITATLLHIFLETVGCTMQNTYKKEFKKLILFIISVYMPMLKKVDTGGPYTRLEVLLQEYQQREYFLEPNGILKNNYW